MKYIFLPALLCFGFTNLSAVTHVFWYKVLTNSYNLSANPGPHINVNTVVHEGKMASGGISGHGGSNYSDFVFGSGLNDAQGRCAWFWSKDLCDMKGTIVKATYRAEYKDGWAGNAFCNAGPVGLLARKLRPQPLSLQLC